MVTLFVFIDQFQCACIASISQFSIFIFTDALHAKAIEYIHRCMTKLHDVSKCYLYEQAIRVCVNWRQVVDVSQQKELRSQLLQKRFVDERTGFYGQGSFVVTDFLVGLQIE